MRVLFLVALLGACCLRAEDEPDNINSKYTVESVAVLPESAGKRISSALQSEIDALIGQKFDPATADKVRNRISEQLHRKVERIMERGDKPEHVKVIYSAPRVFQV